MDATKHSIQAERKDQDEIRVNKNADFQNDIVLMQCKAINPNNTVGIQITDSSRIQMIEYCLVVEWLNHHLYK